MLAADGVPVVGGLSLTAKAYALFDGDELSVGLLIVETEFVFTATTIKFPEATFDANARAKEAPPVAVTLLCCTRAMVFGTTVSTVKLIPLLATPDTVTTTLPVVAPAGTGATMLVALQLVGVASVPLKSRVLVPWVNPKLVPVMGSAVPTAAEVGDKPVMLGAATTAKLIPLLATPDTVTTTLPVFSFNDTAATEIYALSLHDALPISLNCTVLVPWVAPKFVPVMVTDVPTAAEVGDKPVMLGAATTAKLIPLLATPDTVTTTLPVVAPAGTGATMLVALQLVGVASVPLNCTVLVPWVAPKFVPVMVTDVPTAAEVGDKPVTPGAATTAPLIPTPATPGTVTTSCPVVAPAGTG